MKLVKNYRGKEIYVTDNEFELISEFGAITIVEDIPNSKKVEKYERKLEQAKDDVARSDIFGSNHAESPTDCECDGKKVKTIFRTIYVPIHLYI
jgi:hypothetical protein